MSEKGVIFEYPSSTYTTWIRYAKETMKRNKKEYNQKAFTNKLEYFESTAEMRRYAFEKVVEFVGGDSKSEQSFK